jgi:iron complex outermembrane receptor protein
MGKRDVRRWCGRLCVAASALAAGLSMAPSGGSAQTQLPGIVVIAPAPLAASSTKVPSTITGAPGESAAVTADPTLIDRDKVPSGVEVMTSADFDHNYSPTFLDALNRGLPSVSLRDQTGNPFQRDLDYRGFTASPVQGTPQGIAVYQNGVRVNESFGDVVNWDFIPEKAIDRVTLYPGNPVFGLNAIGGALSIQMKNGFTYQGTELEMMGGSFGRAQGSLEYGMQKGNFAAYGLFESAYDRGWRDFANSSRIKRMYMDLGTRNESTEFHISFTGADNTFGNVTAAPIEMLRQSWSSVYTWPNSTRLQLAFLNATLNHKFSDTWSFQGNVYYRGFRQSHVDGNGTDVQPCDDDASILCLGDGADSGDATINKNGPGVSSDIDGYLGEIDRNRVSSDSFGGTAQLTSASKVLGRDNHFVAGASVDRGFSQFSAKSELGTIDPDTLFVKGLGVFIDTPFDAGLFPVSVNTVNTYLGVYATDTFDVTSRLSITMGGRFNLAQISLQDQTGSNDPINGDHQFQRFNPVVGATYKLGPGLTLYGGYSEANRAPTPLELGCSSPTTPCVLDAFLVADPPLKQVVSHTFEAGLRGSYGKNAKARQLSWGLGLFRTLSENDIIEEGSAQGQQFGFFANAGKTRRQGLEAKLNYAKGPWNLYANYTYVDATFQSSETLFSPDNPALADPDNPVVEVRPGDHIPGIPAHRFKIGAEYAATDAWKIGADLYAVSSQFLIRDYTNESPKVPGYGVVNLHTSYQVTPNLELFGLVNNVFDHRYYLQGTFLQAGGFTNYSNGQVLQDLNGPTFVPGMPLAAYAGMRWRF